MTRKKNVWKTFEILLANIIYTAHLFYLLTCFIFCGSPNTISNLPYSQNGVIQTAGVISTIGFVVHSGVVQLEALMAGINGDGDWTHVTYCLFQHVLVSLGQVHILRYVPVHLEKFQGTPMI